MKKKTPLILIALFFAYSHFSFAAIAPFTRLEINHRGYSSGIMPSGASSNAILDEVVVKVGPGLIYNMTLIATATNATLDVFDSATNGPSATTADTINEKPIYEVRVATAGDTRSADTSAAPVQTSEGIAITVSNGYAIINYE